MYAMDASTDSRAKCTKYLYRITASAAAATNVLKRPHQITGEDFRRLSETLWCAPFRKVVVPTKFP